MSDPHHPSIPAGGQSPADDAATDLAPPSGRRLDKMPRKFGRYRIQDCLGRGGMGAVFRAHDTTLDRTVALKVPFLGDDGDETRQRFFREARAAATLHHANICPVYDVGEEHGLPYLTMAFIEGRSLAKVLQDGPPVAPAQAALLVRKLALAMQEAHAHGIVHRDLKPANVMLRAGGEPVIMDFGLARRADDQASEGLTRRGDVIGTLEYMPPEQLEGDNAAVGPRADVYALGVLLYEALTGRRPFAGSTTKILAAILTKPPPRPSEVRPGVPPRLDEICLRAMARDPAARYQTMADFAAALTDFIRTPGPVVAAPPAAGQHDPTPPTPGRSTRPVRGATTVVEPAEAPPEPTPAPATSSARRSRSGSRRKKKAREKSNRPLVLGGVAAGVALLAVAAGVALWPRDTPRTAHQPNPNPNPNPPAVSAPTPQPPPADPPAPRAKAAPKAAAPAAAKSSAKAPARAAAPGTPVVRLQPDAVRLAVGEVREVAVDVRWNGTPGPLSVRWEGPPELQVSPAGPVTVKPGSPGPKLTLRLMATPADRDAALTVTATPDAGRATVTARLAVRLTPGPCTRILEVADRPGTADALALTPDASLALVGGGPDKPPGAEKKAPDSFPIKVWDLRTGRPVAPLAGHTGRVIQLVVSGDGKTALSVSADETVALWDLASGKRESQSPKQPLRVLHAAVSPDGRSALAVYPKVIVRVNLDKFQPAGPPIQTAQLTGSSFDDAVQAVALSADRKALVGGLEGKLFLLDLAGKARPKTLPGHKEAVRSAAFAPGGGLAATGGGGVLQVGEVRPGKDNVVCAWDTAAGALRWRAEGHAAPVVCVAFDAAGRRVASGGADGEVRVWDAATGGPVAEFRGHTGRVLALAFTPEGNGVTSGAADGTVREWRLP